MEGFDSKNNFKNMDFESADINPYADNSLNVKSWRRLFDSMEDGEDKLMISKDFFISDHEDKLLDEFDAIVASKNDSKSHGQNIEKNSVESLISQNERYRVQINHLNKELRNKDTKIEALEQDIFILKERLMEHDPTLDPNNLISSRHDSENGDHVRLSTFKNTMQRQKLTGIGMIPKSMADLFLDDERNVDDLAAISERLTLRPTLEPSQSVMLDNALFSPSTADHPLNDNSAKSYSDASKVSMRDLAVGTAVFSDRHAQRKRSEDEIDERLQRETSRKLNECGLFPININDEDEFRKSTTSYDEFDSTCFDAENMEHLKESKASKSNRLFEDIPVRTKKTSTASQAQDMSYQDFVYKLMKPECKDMVDALRRFLVSVLGAENADPMIEKLDVTYCGSKDIANRTNSFIEAMINHMNTHVIWKGMVAKDKDVLVVARDYLERYVMKRIAALAFKAVEDVKADEELFMRMKCLKFLTPEAFDIKPELCNDMVWAIARDELRKINSYKTPEDKVACIVNCASVLYRSLNLARAKVEENPDESGLGADDFLPSFIWVVLTSDVHNLQSNCEYIQAFHNPVRLMGKAGYCFVNLRSAIEFILTLDSHSLSIDPELFEKYYFEAQKSLSINSA